MKLLKKLRRLLRRRRSTGRDAPGESTRSVLLITSDHALADRVTRLARGEGYEPVVVNSGGFGLDRASRSEHLLVVADVPLADLELGEFLAELRSRNGRRRGGLLVLTSSDVRAEVQGKVGGSATVLVRHAPDDLLRTVMVRLASAAPRKRPGAAITARVIPEAHFSPLVCPVVNLSASGVLVVTQRLLPVGSRCQVVLAAEGTGESYATDGWIVRHQRPNDPSDPVLDRMAIQFLEGGHSSRERLLRFLELV